MRAGEQPNGAGLHLNSLSNRILYCNRFWLAKYLVDQEGAVRFAQFVEGGAAHRACFSLNIG